MFSYRFVELVRFPELMINEEVGTIVNLEIPGFTESASTRIRFVSNDHHGFELYEITHQIRIKDTGTAYGFLDDRPVTLPFKDYLKTFTVFVYVHRSERYLLFAQTAAVVKDLFGRAQKNTDLQTELIAYELDLDMIREIVEEYRAVWMRGISTRVTSTGLFGSDLVHDPLFGQLLADGAHLSSVTVPFMGINVQINSAGGVSSHQKFDSTEAELFLVRSLKTDLIDRVRKP